MTQVAQTGESLIIPDMTLSMQPLDSLEKQPAFMFLDAWQQQLVRLSFTLWQREYRTQTRFLDYTFVVFPMAKAYEGFLKTYLWQFNLISEATFRSRKFRIGRALNPDVSYRQRDADWIYDDVSRVCGPDLARKMWDAWLTCRNQLFHYFPDKEKGITLQQAGTHLQTIFAVMDEAVACAVRREA